VSDLVARLVAHDPTLFEGETAHHALGWMEHPERYGRQWLNSIADSLPRRHERVVVLGMGGSSGPARLWRDAKGSAQPTIIDTSHPDDIASFDFTNTTVIVGSKSGGTIETRSALAYALDKGVSVEDLVVITDPGSGLHEFATSLDALVVDGDPLCGGRFSALSPFGLVPALYAGYDVEEVAEIVAANSLTADLASAAVAAANEIVANMADGAGTMPIGSSPVSTGGGLWIDQLVAESSGKQGRGVVPVLSDTHQSYGPRELMHFHLVAALVSRAAGVDPFNQPNVESAKKNVSVLLGEPVAWSVPELDTDALRSAIARARYVTWQVFAPNSTEHAVDELQRHCAASGHVVTANLGPRYLHSTGQLHKGGPGPVVCIQVLQRPTHEVPVPGEPYSFNDLCAAQAMGDAHALRDAGRDVFQIVVDDVSTVWSELAPFF
jgi:glucose-6-phosphate isomerase